jgi:hypothetical protein
MGEVTMKRFLFVLGLGIGIGFVLGSRAGREPYERLEAKVKEVSGRDDVQAAAESATHAVADLRDRAVNAAAEKVEDVSTAADATVGGGPNHQRSTAGR